MAKQGVKLRAQQFIVRMFITNIFLCALVVFSSAAPAYGATWYDTLPVTGEYSPKAGIGDAHPNISNKMIPVPHSGAPDSEATTGNSDTSFGEATGFISGGTTVQNRSLSTPTHSSGMLRYILVVSVGILLLIVFGWYLWRQRPEHSSFTK